MTYADSERGRDGGSQPAVEHPARARSALIFGLLAVVFAAVGLISTVAQGRFGSTNAATWSG